MTTTNFPFARSIPGLIRWSRREALAALLRKRILLAALIVCTLGSTYWLLIASDLYVSEAHVVVERTDLSGGKAMDFSNLLAGMGASARPDQLLLRDHLLSVAMLRKLDAALHLRDHYSDRSRDPLSRMWSRDDSIEWFHRHYLSRVSVELDDYGGVLVIKAQAYEPKMAHAITTMLVHEGETFMNQMAHSLAQAQVDFLEQQLGPMKERVERARRAVLEFQNREGLVSPQATAESISAIVARLEAERSGLQTQRTSLQAYLVAGHPSIVLLNDQIAAIDAQIAREKGRLAAPGGKPLNATVERFQRVEEEAAFAHEIYKTALVALERGRVEATRTIKKVLVLEAPTLPEYAMEPRRFYNTAVLLLVVALISGVVYLLAAIVRDHTD